MSTYTYTDTLPTDLDKARSLLGDTDIGDPLLGDTDIGDPLFSDEHIKAVIALAGSLDAGVARLADELVVTFARDPIRYSSDGASVDMSARIPAWEGLAARLRPAPSGQAGSSPLSFVPATFGAAVQDDEYGRPNRWSR